MSLIVDINPVPWEILEQVKARLLKNRAKKQKRQPEKPGELRRVMQADNGILAKQRWEEPSFIGGRDRVFVIRAGGYISYTRFGVWQVPTSYTIKVNGKIIGDVNRLPLAGIFEPSWFIWSASDNDINEITGSLYSVPGPQEIRSITVMETEQPDPNETLTIELSNLTGTGLFGGLPEEIDFIGISFVAFFAFDEELTRARGRSETFPINRNPGTVTYLLQDWKS
jgi:hypothetical protein